MRNLTPLLLVIAITLLILSSTGQDQNAAQRDCPDGRCPYGVVVETYSDVPQQLRQENWTGSQNEGSCVHASTITLLRWQGQEEIADWWAENYDSGEYASRLVQRMEGANLRYAYTDAGSAEFLEWACRNRYAAGIFYFYRHAVNIVKFDHTGAYLIDNNDPYDIIHVPRDVFLWRWQNEYGGFAWTVVYSPPPPTPTW